ncbi:MAG TPA: hypothetical protein VED45_05415 [Steroidobacteraceae bacterium]|nr:hypothetical protein [Steroidobacteraceae bacterium]
MGTFMRLSRAVFASALIGLGMIGLIYGNSALIWEPIPKALPGRLVIIYLCAFIELGTGIGLLLRPSVILACRVLLPFLLLWLALLKLPGLFRAPQVMVSWEAFGEVAATAAGGWCLFAAHAGIWEQRHLKVAVGENGIRTARLLLIAALPMIGLSHFVYHDLTASLVPKWMRFPLGWTYLTGAGSLAAAAGMLFGIYPRLAANLEAAMLWIITLLVWVPRVTSMPNDQGNWTEFFISCAIAAGAWLVADTYRSVAWLASGKAARAVFPD